MVFRPRSKVILEVHRSSGHSRGRIAGEIDLFAVHGHGESGGNPNRTGATTVDGSAFVKLTLPIFHWGERRRATGAARAVQRQSEWNTALLHDNIVRDEMNGWTALVNSRAQVDATEQSLRIAGENLDISTYSYGEGLSTILDVLQAQLSWIQLYTNAIKAHYNYAVAVSDYLRITAQ